MARLEAGNRIGLVVVLLVRWELAGRPARALDARLPALSAAVVLRETGEGAMSDQRRKLRKLWKARRRRPECMGMNVYMRRWLDSLGPFSDTQRYIAGIAPRPSYASRWRPRA